MELIAGSFRRQSPEVRASVHKTAEGHSPGIRDVWCSQHPILSCESPPGHKPAPVGCGQCAVTGPALLSSFHLHLPALCPVPVTSLLGERQQRTEAKQVDVGGRLWGSESQLDHLLTEWPRAAYLISLSFTSPIYRKGVTIIPL